MAEVKIVAYEVKGRLEEFNEMARVNNESSIHLSIEELVKIIMFIDEIRAREALLFRQADEEIAKIKAEYNEKFKQLENENRMMARELNNRKEHVLDRTTIPGKEFWGNETEID